MFSLRYEFHAWCFSPRGFPVGAGIGESQRSQEKPNLPDQRCVLRFSELCPTDPSELLQQDRTPLPTLQQHLCIYWPQQYLLTRMYICVPWSLCSAALWGN